VADLIGISKKKTVAAHLERVGALLYKLRKGCLDLALATCIHGHEAHPMGTRRNIDLPRFALGINGIGRVAEVTDQRGLRYQFEQQFKALCGRFGRQESDAGDIAARPIEAINEANLDRVCALHKNNRDRLGRRFGCKRTICAFQYSNYGYLMLN
jgi:hypothetical protein